MYLLPAIDLLGGRAVRLAKGDYAAVTVYNDDPALQAQLFEEAGATWLHVVDLDGAKSGNPDNLEVVRAILARTTKPIKQNDRSACDTLPDTIRTGTEQTR